MGMGMPYAQEEFLLGTRLYGDPIIEEEGEMDVGYRQLTISHKAFLTPSFILL